jgi:hypothetical protein
MDQQGCFHYLGMDHGLADSEDHLVSSHPILLLPGNLITIQRADTPE